MLAIRLQRTGRKGHAQFRMIVQDARRTPTSGRYVALLGNFDPHTKELKIDKEKAKYYLKNGARPSDRAALLLKKDGVKLPAWVKVKTDMEGKTKSPEKLRKNQPEQKPETKPETPEPSAEDAPETPAAEPAEPAEEAAPAETEAASEEKETPETEEKPAEPSETEPADSPKDDDQK